MNDILGVQAEIDFTAGGEDEFGGDEVIFAAGVGGVEAQRIAFVGRDQLRLRSPEGCVLTGIAEVPGELDSDDLHLQGRGVGPDVARGSPEVLGAHRQVREQESQRENRQILDQQLGPAAGAWLLAPLEQKSDEQQQVQECE